MYNGRIALSNGNLLELALFLIAFCKLLVIAWNALSFVAKLVGLFVGLAGIAGRNDGNAISYNCGFRYY